MGAVFAVGDDVRLLENWVGMSMVSLFIAGFAFNWSFNFIQRRNYCVDIV